MVAADGLEELFAARQIGWEIPLIGSLARTASGAPVLRPIARDQADAQPASARIQPQIFPENPLVLEGAQPGGQLSTTTLVENFPGFTDGIDGPQLIVNMHAQAEKFGARFSYAEATGFEPMNSHVRLQIDDKEWLDTESLIIASGASARWLGLENEEKLIGHGLTSCATCDGAFYRNVPVAVVGGGDSAAEEALFLTRFASKIYLIHRRDKLRASKIMADRVLAQRARR